MEQKTKVLKVRFWDTRTLTERIEKYGFISPNGIDKPITQNPDFLGKLRTGESNLEALLARERLEDFEPTPLFEALRLGYFSPRMNPKNPTLQIFTYVYDAKICTRRADKEATLKSRIPTIEGFEPLEGNRYRFEYYYPTITKDGITRLAIKSLLGERWDKKEEYTTKVIWLKAGESKKTPKITVSHGYKTETRDMILRSIWVFDESEIGFPLYDLPLRHEKAKVPKFPKRLKANKARKSKPSIDYEYLAKVDRRISKAWTKILLECLKTGDTPKQPELRRILKKVTQ
uniref:Uncharacterized protein n=1 Tax=viral metagenome TaxID=1070528 RepID=A0A6M3M6N6_9ZZZZ